MPWREYNSMSQRAEFLAFARLPGANITQLCRRFAISRKTGYKWLGRSQAELPDLGDRSRRPHTSPRQTMPGLQDHVIAIRQRYPFYGGRKIHHLLLRQGVQNPPAPSTITAILDRNGLLSPERRRLRNWQRFEHAAPNALWQMDFKGHFPLSRGERCHPLTVLDDHSRFCICLVACPNELGSTVRDHLTAAFRLYGLPQRIITDNGSPWGSPQGLYTQLSAWLIRLGVSVWHGRPLHPQTQGKDERFHRTLKLEVISQRPVWLDNSQAQNAFDIWRPHYNFERPHEALHFLAPGSRYAPSSRAYPTVLPPIEYNSDFTVRRVMDNGRIKLKGRRYFVGKAFCGDPVGLRQVGESVYDVYYCHQFIVRIDLALPPASSEEV
jgi:transposase InsO family protein